MQQINVVIIDDEPIAVEVIKELVSYLTTDLVVVGTATNGVDAVQKISSLKPDLLFMDVHMPLMNGIEVLEKLPDHNFQLIFTTGYESEALKNARHKAIDFLFKPIDPDEFLAAVDKARKKLRFTT
jgi:two-component system, LytTR family, response regulator